MKSLHSKVSTICIFFAAAALLLIYLFTIRYNIFLPITIFWVAIVLMLSTILYQCLQLKLSSDYVKIILLEIAVTCIVFHLIEQIPYYGLSGSDAYVDLVSAKSILSTGFIRGDPNFLNSTSYYPTIHILGVQLSSIFNIDLLTAAKWFPLFIDVAFILLLYLFIRRVFKDERIALLSALCVVCLRAHILFGSLFIRETIALVLLVGCLYFYFSARSTTTPVTYIALSIICLMGTIIAHHFTSFMLVLFILLHFSVTKVAGISYIRRTYLDPETVGEKITVSFVLIALMALFGYWLYVVKILPPYLTLISFFESLFQVSAWGATTYSDVAGISPDVLGLRGNILFWGFFLSLFFFGIILIYGLLPRLKNNRIEALSFTLFLFICGLMALLELYVVPFGIGIYPDRFLVFGWLFGFAPLLFLILSTRNNLFRRVGISLLFTFMLLNIYAIDPFAWDVQSTDVPSAAMEEDYALANTLDFSTDNIAGHTYALMAIYDVHNHRGRNFQSYPDIKLSTYEWVVVHKEALKRDYLYLPGNTTIAELWGLLKEPSPEWIKVYESNNLALLQPSSD